MFTDRFGSCFGLPHFKLFSLGLGSSDLRSLSGFESSLIGSGQVSGFGSFSFQLGRIDVGLFESAHFRSQLSRVPIRSSLVILGLGHFLGFKHLGMDHSDSG